MHSRRQVFELRTFHLLCPYTTLPGVPEPREELTVTPEVPSRSDHYVSTHGPPTDSSGFQAPPFSRRSPTTGLARPYESARASILD